MLHEKMVYDKAIELVNIYETHDSIVIAESLGLGVMPIPYTEEFIGTHGVLYDQPVIVTNDNFCIERQKEIVAHELAHYFFDDLVSISKYAYYGNDYQLMKDDKYAEIFTACLLLDGEDIYDYIYTYRFTFSQIAKIMHVDEKYVKLRYEMMMKYEFEKYRKIFRNII